MAKKVDYTDGLFLKKADDIYKLVVEKILFLGNSKRYKILCCNNEIGLSCKDAGYENIYGIEYDKNLFRRPDCFSEIMFDIAVLDSPYMRLFEEKVLDLIFDHGIIIAFVSKSFEQLFSLKVIIVDKIELDDGNFLITYKKRLECQTLFS